MKISVKLRERERKNSIVLYLDLYHNGKRLPYEPLGIHLSKDPKQKIANRRRREFAEQKRQEREEQLIQGIVQAPVTMEVAGFLRSIGNERKVQQWHVVADYWDKFANGRKITLADLRPQTFEAFERSMTEAGLNVNSVVTYMRKLKAGVNLAITRKLLKDRPFTGANLMAPEEPLREYLEPHELETLARTKIPIQPGHRTRYTNNQREDIKWAFIFCCYQGLRLSDVATLQKADVRFVTVDGESIPAIPKRQQKTRRPVYNMLHPVAWEIIQDREGRLFDLPPLKLCAYYIRKLAKAAGIQKRVTFHVSRHTAAMQLLMATDDLYATKEHLGHTDIRTTMIYAKMLPGAMSKAVRKMPSITLPARSSEPSTLPETLSARSDS